MIGALQRILENHQPPLEQEVSEYLEGILDEFTVSEPPDEDELETLSSTLVEFLDEGECDAILTLLTERKSNLPTPSGRDSPRDLVSHGQASLGGKLGSDEPTSQSTKHEIETNGNEVSPGDDDHKKSRKEKRKEKRHTKHKKGAEKSSTPAEKVQEAATSDDHTSAWKECQEDGKLWGGRGHGGRGIRYTGENYDNVHLPSVSLQFAGNELLVDSPMDIVRGHRYGLIGRNGVGKSTLLRSLASHSIPGIPHGMRIILVQQQVQGSDDKTALEALVEADTDRTELLAEMERVELWIEEGVKLEENAERLGDIANELDVIDAETAEERATEILKGLAFSDEMINGPTSNLSGGWRMRLALAQALFVPYSDLILLDEVSNHLDLHGMEWLIRYLTNENAKHKKTIMIVSHDRSFLDAICTDIIVMEHQRLSYHVGSFSDYQRQVEEKAARQAQILDASARQRAKAEAFIQKQANNKKSTDPNKQRQAKMIREKKLDRLGNYREDGKRYKQFSLKQMDESDLRTAQKVVIERDDAVLKLRFPDPTWPPGVSEGSPLVQLDSVSFGYETDGDDFLLRDLTLNLERGSKIALVGRNGCGKSTLIKLIVGEKEGIGKGTGKVWRHPSLRFGHVTQYSVEELEDYGEMTVVEYAENILASGRASSSVIKEASGNVRQYLGAFGLGGAHALRRIKTLSGGERMRLCFATVLSDEPHVLFLDESTNHVDLETLDSLSAALNDYQGSVLMVSHNQGFLSGFCKELWVLENGRVDVSHQDTGTFDELFSNYRDHILSSSGSTARKEQRQLRTNLAQKASKQTSRTKGTTTLFS